MISIYLRCISYPGENMPDLIIDIHFNPDHPENHNIIPINNGTEFDVYINNKYVRYSLNDMVKYLLTTKYEFLLGAHSKTSVYIKENKQLYEKKYKNSLVDIELPHGCGDFKENLSTKILNTINHFDLNGKKNIKKHYVINN